MNTRKEINELISAGRFKLFLKNRTGSVFEAKVENRLKYKVCDKEIFCLVQDMTPADWVLLVQNLIMQLSRYKDRK